MEANTLTNSPFGDNLCTNFEGVKRPNNGGVHTDASHTTLTGQKKFLGCKGYDNGVAEFAFYPPFEEHISV